MTFQIDHVAQKLTHLVQIFLACVCQKIQNLINAALPIIGASDYLRRFSTARTPPIIGNHLYFIQYQAVGSTVL